MPGTGSTCSARSAARSTRNATHTICWLAEAWESEGNVITLLDRMESQGELAAGGLEPVVLSCGPLPMMKAVALWTTARGIECQLSMEQRMGCGYGTCVTCVVDTVAGRSKVCSDGPVFTAQQLGWEA